MTSRLPLMQANVYLKYVTELQNSTSYGILNNSLLSTIPTFIFWYESSDVLEETVKLIIQPRVLFHIYLLRTSHFVSRRTSVSCTDARDLP